MAIPTVVGVGAAASGTTAVTAAFPGGYTAVADDIGLIFCECEGADTPAAPSGWTIAATVPVATGTTTKLFLLWRRIQAGDTAPSVPDPGNHLNVRMIVLRGCVTTGNPWDILITDTELASDTSVSITGGTTTVANCLVLAAVGTGQDIATTAGIPTFTNASLANLTERMDNWTSSGTGGGFAVCSGEKATAGTVNATTATLTSPLVSNFKALLTIALKGGATTHNADATLAITATRTIGATADRPAAAALAVTATLTAAGTRGAWIRQVLSGHADGTSVTLNTASGTLASDVLLCLHGADFSTAANMTTPTAGTWTHRATGDNGTDSYHVKAWTRTADAGANAVTVPAVGASENFQILYVIAAADTTNPADGAQGGNGAASTSHIAPSVSPSTDAAVLVAAALTSPTNYTAPGDLAENAEEDGDFSTMTAASAKLAASGATGTKTFTSSANSPYASLTIAIRSAGAGGGPVTHNADATLAVTATLTAAGTGTRPAAAALAITATRTAAAALTAVAAAALAVTATLTAAAARTATIGATLAVTATATTAAARTATIAAPLATTATLTVAGTVGTPPIEAAYALPATAALTAAATRQAATGAALALTATTATTAAATRPLAATLTLTTTSLAGLALTTTTGAALALTTTLLAATTTSGAYTPMRHTLDGAGGVAVGLLSDNPPGATSGAHDQSSARTTGMLT